MRQPAYFIDELRLQMAFSHPLFTELQALRIPLKDCVIMSGFALYIYGVRDDKRRFQDIDLVASSELWLKMRRRYKSNLIRPKSGKGEGIQLIGPAGKLEIFSDWPGVETEEIMAEAYDLKYGLSAHGRQYGIKIASPLVLKKTLLARAIPAWDDLPALELYMDTHLKLEVMIG